MERKQLEESIERTMNDAGIPLPEGPIDNTIQNFFFDDEEVQDANEEGKLLKLDLDVGRYCNLACDFCYVNTINPDSDDYVRGTTDRLKGIIDEGVELGLQSIKIVGAGEPFLFPGLLSILEHAYDKGVGSLVFTGGHIIGDDNVARRVYRKDGVKDGTDLANRLNALGSSVIVKYMTFNDDLHTELVAPKGKLGNYAVLRDKGLLRLVEAGFNATTPTRLGVDTLVLDSTYTEARDIFSLFNKYNVFVLMKTPVNCGGTAINGSNPVALQPEHAVEAAANVYAYCQEEGITMNFESPYFGGPPCSQLNHAVHIGDDTTVKPCPGADTGMATYKPGNLAQIWQENKARQTYGDQTSHICPPRHGITMFEDFKERVVAKLHTT